MKIKAYKLYTLANGDSDVAEGFIESNIISEAKSISFAVTPSGSSYDWHTAPTTQYVITQSGTLQFTTSNGKSFTLKPGEILLATDTTGKGHKWHLTDESPWIRTYVPFDDLNTINFDGA